MKPNFACTGLILSLVILCSAFAEEGMWMPQQIPELALRLQSLGFDGDAGKFADLTGHPMGAVISLGFCTASFVSPDGLMATNHHCAVGALQYNSTPERNLLVDGFLAKTKEDELWNGPGAKAWVALSVKEVTQEITGGIGPEVQDRERYKITERRIKERTQACEKGGLRCRVASFFEGLKYFEIAQLEIQDVRLVYAPAEGIGVFGGETDNWQWPRHTGDFTFFRAYVGKDGKPAPYSKDNVPFKPKQWLKVSPAGANPGDLIFVGGYPGNTRRHDTLDQIKDLVDWGLPRQIRRAKEQLALLDEITKNSPETRIKVAGRIQGLNNGLTNNEGTLKGLIRGGILKKKQDQDQALRAWIAAQPGRKEYAEAIAALDGFQQEIRSTRAVDAALDSANGGSALLGAAVTIHRLSVERPKPDLEREPELQERNWSRLRETQERMERTYDPKADRALFRYGLQEIMALPEGQRIAVWDQAIGLKPGMSAADQNRALEAFLDRMYAGTKLGDKAFRVSLLEKNTEEILATKDPFIELAAALFPLMEQRRERDKTRDGFRQRVRPVYMRALLEQQGGQVAPDANGTLRITFGKVEGVASRDGLFFLPQTTLQGIVEKHTGSGDFNAPARQLEAIQALRNGKKTPFFDPKLGDVPVNFLATVDTTGGNSGSAALNSKGELVGLLFDGTYDTVASDILYDTVRTRSIVCDSRYMLWVMAEVDGAGHLLKEMSLNY